MRKMYEYHHQTFTTDGQTYAFPLSEVHAGGYRRRRTCRFVIGTLFLLFTALPCAACAEGNEPTGDEILRRIDGNLVLEEAFLTYTMIIHGRSGTRTIMAQGWKRGRDSTLVEYLSPAREKGKKMLRLGDKIWNYTPEPNDRIIAISGHLLRQSVMGSDLSYEDMTENRNLADLYDADVTGTEEMDGRGCYVVLMTAKTDDVAYYSRKVWVDTERWLPLKEERYAKSGKLLKITRITDAFRQGERWYPKRMTFDDVLSKGGGTEYLIDSIDFDVDIPDYMLTKAALRR